MTTQSAFDRQWDQKLRAEENKLFMKQFFKKPGQLGTIAPISVALAREAASKLRTLDGKIVEIGAGTGRLTRALFERGVEPHNLIAVELDGALCSFLKNSLDNLFPTLDQTSSVVHGDASFLNRLIPASWCGSVQTVVSAIPFMYLPEDKRIEIVESAFRVLEASGDILHVTYNPKSPLAFTDAYHQERVVAKWLNLPPGFVWRFSRKG
jgi:phosphatidylethanolamine/phosphatidyl-N-methylethanolamine N-methyltransferase